MTSTQLQHVVDELAERLGRTVAVDDVDIQLLAASPHTGAIDPARLDIVLQRRTRPDLVAFVRTLGLPTVRGYRRVPAEPRLELLPRIVWPLRDHDELYGYLWLIDSPPVGPVEIGLTSAAAAQIGPLLAARAREADAVTARDTRLVRVLVGSDEHDRGKALADLHQAGRLDAELPSRVVVFRPAPGQGPCGLGPVTDLVRDTGGGRPTAAIDGEVVLVTDDPGWHPRAVSREGGRSVGQRLRATTTGRGLARMTIGTSPVGEPGDLARARERAHHAALVADHLAGRTVGGPGDADVTHWERLGAWQLLHGLPWTRETVVALHPPLEVLLDPVHRQLAVTLATYLDCGGDTAATVAALCVHRATFYHRRDRVRELIGRDWETGWGRVGVHAALVLAAVLDPGLRSPRGLPG